MIKSVFILFLLAFPFCLTAQREMSFTEEYIDFAIDRQWFTTNGVYVFVNNTDKKIQYEIKFPFAVGIDSIEVLNLYNLSYHQQIQFRPLKNSIGFMLEIAPKDTINVNIAYRQMTLKNNIYILRSTATWGQPLQKANYSLTVNENLKIESLSYPPDSQKENVYYWEKQDFFPSKDFEAVLSNE